MRIRCSATTGNLTINAGSPGYGMFQLLHDDHSRAFAHHKTVAVPVEGPRGALGLTVTSAERPHGRKSCNADFNNGRLGAPGEGPVVIEVGPGTGTLTEELLARGADVVAVEIDRDLAVWLRGNDVARRLMTIPGIGPIGATALAASVTDPQQFRSGRQFAAWLGLTPLQKSSGGKQRLGRITKMGDIYLRKLLIVGMTSLVRRAKYNPDKIDPRLADLLARKPTRVATVAMANKTARVIWAIMSRGETYDAGHRPAPAA